ncbi:hypothetical protein C8A05DRAFT_45078 [Staphylotrichum tortipilum]|uniref:FAD-binding domain-containing protein n=1 Tax=Staphylotrichum tortipilum TaxID=2831512 RepID=A0AAN6MJC4_9PEZI|nr:hypothetical protein C8A05DRAFT_45078 [Staphylotrichum longicolle]
MPPSRPNPPHLALIGAGITGTTLSLALTRRNISHTLYEQSPFPSEVGAGLGFGANAARAMEVIDPALARVFVAGRTGADVRASFAGSGNGNGGEPVWIEFVDGTAEGDEAVFTVFARGGEGHGAVHRAKWLGVLMGRVAGGVVRFGKRLERIGVGEGARGRMLLRFADGTVEEADAVIGCDGVKSRVRELMVHGEGENVQAAKCSYSGKYAYRCMIPMAKAVEAVGSNRAGVSSLWMGHGRHVLTFPVGEPGPDQLLNLVAFVTDSSKTWPSADARSLTLPTMRDDALRDFEQGGFGPSWGLFDLAAHPLPRFHFGRILVIGDAAHASTPHHGSGAGFCIEDVAVLASLLEELDDPASHQTDLEAVFAAFDASRRERDQWLVQSSRRAADVYEWRLPGTGRGHFEAMREGIQARQGVCWGINLDRAIREAKEYLRSRRVGGPREKGVDCA